MARGEKPELQKFWAEWTKGFGKDTVLAISIIWLLMFAVRMLRIQVGAYDQVQADEIRLIVRQILKLDHPLIQAIASKITVKGDTIDGRNDSVCEILTTDSSGSHGSRPDVMLINELSNIGNKDFAETLFDNADKMPNGLVIIATNAGHFDTWQYTWHQIAIAEGWHCSFVKEPAPWISKAALAQSRLRNPTTRYLRFWEGQWVRQSGDALEASDVDAAITLQGPIHCPAETEDYFGGADLSISQDASAFAVVGRNRKTLQLRLANLWIWRPQNKRIDLTAIQATIAEASDTFDLSPASVPRSPPPRPTNRPAHIYMDPYQGVHMAQELAKRTPRVEVDTKPFNGQSLVVMATMLLELFRTRRISLFRHEQLIRDLLKLNIESKPYGFRLNAERDKSRHCDAATALILACLSAQDSPARNCRLMASGASGSRAAFAGDVMAHAAHRSRWELNYGQETTSKGNHDDRDNCKSDRARRRLQGYYLRSRHADLVSRYHAAVYRSGQRAGVASSRRNNCRASGV